MTCFICEEVINGTEAGFNLWAGEVVGMSPSQYKGSSQAPLGSAAALEKQRGQLHGWAEVPIG